MFKLAFAAATNFAVNLTPQVVEVGDFNGDGKPDLAAANSGSHNVSVLLKTFVSNVPPTIASNEAAVSANEGSTATITVTATDGSGASVSVTFNVAVVSPAQQAYTIIQLIQQWKTDGKINAGVANSMIVKVENALKSYDKGNITAAGNQLNALKNEISAKVKPGAAHWRMPLWPSA